VWETFTEAAAYGHLAVLEFTMGVQGHRALLRIYHGGALARAIEGHQTPVVDFLLSKCEFDWGLLDMFEEAVAQGQAATAERICNMYPLSRAERNLLVDSAWEGRANAVEYLFNNGCRDSELVCHAFVRAAAVGCTDVVGLLYETGLISSDAFGKACNCANKWSCRAETLLYFYGLKRAAPQIINQWFERVRDMSVLKLLYEK
jgi:hypothetical protein